MRGSQNVKKIVAELIDSASQRANNLQETIAQIYGSKDKFVAKAKLELLKESDGLQEPYIEKNLKARLAKMGDLEGIELEKTERELREIIEKELNDEASKNAEKEMKDLIDQKRRNHLKELAESLPFGDITLKPKEDSKKRSK